MVDSETNSSVVKFNELVNPSTVTPGYGPEDRIDPYWSMVWPDSDGGPEVIWRSICSERRVAEAGIHVPIRRGHIFTPAEAIELLSRRIECRRGSSSTCSQSNDRPYRSADDPVVFAVGVGTSASRRSEFARAGNCELCP